MNAEMPTMLSSSNSCATYDMASMNAVAATTTARTVTNLGYCAALNQLEGSPGSSGTTGPVGSTGAFVSAFANHNTRVYDNPKGARTVSRRYVTVIVMDPNESVPLEQCVIYKGEEKLTEATDQELFFELDVRDVLEKYNAKRVGFQNKRVKDRTEYLEPAKIRDLKMVVVNGATF